MAKKFLYLRALNEVTKIKDSKVIFDIEKLERRPFNKNDFIINMGDTNSLGRRNNEYKKGDKGFSGHWNNIPFKTFDLTKTGYKSDGEVFNTIKTNKKFRSLVKYLGKWNASEGREVLPGDSNYSDELLLIKGNSMIECIENYKKFECLLSEVLFGADTYQTFVLRIGPQEQAIEALNKWKITTEREMLINLVCRMGKSFIELYDLQHSTNKFGLHISGKTESLQALIETYYDCCNFRNDIELISLKAFINTNINKLLKLNKKYMIYSTCQYLEKHDKEFDDLKSVIKENLIIYFDESHYYNTTKLQSIINEYKIVYLSGTPLELLESGKFSYAKNNLYEYTLVNAIVDKKSGEEWVKNYLTPTFYWLGNLKREIITNTNFNKEDKARLINELDNGFDFNTISELDEVGNFIREIEFNLFLEALVLALIHTGKKSFILFGTQGTSNGKIEKINNKINNIISKLNINGKCIYAAGDNGGKSNKDIKYEFDDMCRDCVDGRSDLAILVSYQKFSTGTTFEDLDAVVLLTDKNIKETIQIWGRPCSSSYKNPNKEPAVYYIDKKQLSTDLFRSFINYNKNLDLNSLPSTITYDWNNFTSCFSIYEVLMSGGFKEMILTFDESFMSYKKYSKYNSVLPLDIYTNETIRNLISKINTINCVTNMFNDDGNGSPKGKKVSSKLSNKKLSNNGVKLSEQQLKEKLIELSKYLKQCWYYSRKNTFKKFLNYYSTHKEMFNDITEISYNDFVTYFIPLLNKKEFEIICNNFVDTIDIYSDLD